MNTVRQSCRPKHQVLILRCYPRFQKNVADVKPNASELSYLLYYASTRRSKLQKVGAFLEKRTAVDVSKARIGYETGNHHATRKPWAWEGAAADNLRVLAIGTCKSPFRF